MKKPSLGVMILYLFMLCSCGARDAVISQNRFQTTGIQPQEAIVILLSEHREDKSISDPQDKEPEFEECLKKSIEEESPKIKIIPAKQFREVMSFDNETTSADEILYSLNNEETQKRASYLGIRYIVNVDVDTHRSGPYGTPDSVGIGGGIFVIGWKRYSAFSAQIIDIVNRGISGDVSASSEGDVGFGCCLIVLPIPIGTFSRTESKACDSLGKAVHKFLVSKDNPPPKNVSPTENSESKTEQKPKIP